MKRIHGWKETVAAIGFLLLILDSKTALSGAREGMELCLKTVIPSLFPFFVLSVFLTDTLSEDAGKQRGRLGKLLGLPAAAEPVLIPAFLGGYPVGAQCAAGLYRDRQLSKAAAERLLGFCSNAGPSFLFGMVSAFFPEIGTVFALWLIHVAGAMLTAWTMVIPESARTLQKGQSTKPAEPVLSRAVRAMISVCCWILLFRSVTAFLQKWILWRFSPELQVLLTGWLELANGCSELARIENHALRFVICSCILSSGGICVLLQTASVTEGLSLRFYVLGKLRQTVFCSLMSVAWIAGYGILFIILLAGCVFLLRKLQKRDSIPAEVAV